MVPGVFWDEALINEYVAADELPDKIPVAALKTDDWARRIAVPNHVIFRRFDRRGTRVSVTAAREAFVKLVYQRFYRTRENASIIPRELGLDVCQYRTYGEELYGPTLSEILAMREEWRGDPEPKQEALGFMRPLLQLQFRFVRRETDTSTQTGAFW